MRADIPGAVILNPDSILVSKWGDDLSLKSEVRISIDKSGGLLEVDNKTGTTVVEMNTNADGGKFAVYAKKGDGTEVVLLVCLSPKKGPNSHFGGRGGP